jgi:uncharacterized protein YprB with RNaseH-like and TPR domain
LSSLADRIRGIVAPRAGADPRGGPATGGHTGPPLLASHVDIAAVLDGTWQGGAFVVDRRWDPSAFHGRERIGALAERLERSADEAPLFTGGVPARPPFVFFDLETTGLSGGAGTLAFLVGCGWFEGDGSFATRQFLLVRHADERMLLEAVAAELARAGALVSFNGKSFDAPLLEGRYLFHRIAWRGREMPHVDVLHPARRFWKAPATGARAFSLYGARGGDDASCSLQSLERQLVGLRRQGDVPGFEIPALYFQFVRSGDAGPLGAVLEHNRLDLLTLAALTARLLDLTRRGPDAAGDAREALALGHVYARAHRQADGGQSPSTGALEERARTSFRCAIDRCRSPRGAYDPIRIEALRALALTCRRARMHDEAAAAWRELVDMRGCPKPILRDAAEALAIHHEHRVRDLAVAKAFALRNLESGRDLGWGDAARYRLARIDRKLEARSLKFEGEV